MHLNESEPNTPPIPMSDCSDVFLSRIVKYIQAIAEHTEQMEKMTKELERRAHALYM